MRRELAARTAPLNVYVSASSRGLAFDIARRFAADGSNIALSSRSALHLDAARAVIEREAPGVRVVTVPGDLSKPEDQERILAAFDAGEFQPDVFVCSAGHPKEGGLSNLSRTEWDNELEMILGHAVFASQRLAPAMAARDFGRFIFLSSLYAKAPNHEFFMSSLARSGLFSLSKMVGAQYASRGVASFVVCMGFVDTPLLRNRALGRPLDAPGPEMAAAEFWATRYQEWANDIPARRIASPAELAELVAFLASPEAEYLNGTVFSFSGGQDRSIL